MFDIVVCALGIYVANVIMAYLGVQKARCHLFSAVPYWLSSAKYTERPELIWSNLRILFDWSGMVLYERRQERDKIERILLIFDIAL